MIGRYIVVVCDEDCCGEESGPAMTETESRRQAREAGWKVGRNRDERDYCPLHRPK